MWGELRGKEKQVLCRCDMQLAGATRVAGEDYACASPSGSQKTRASHSRKYALRRTCLSRSGARGLERGLETREKIVSSSPVRLYGQRFAGGSRCRSFCRWSLVQSGYAIRSM